MESIPDKIDLKQQSHFGIQNKEIEDNNYLINNKLVVNSNKGNLLNELKRCLSQCEKFYFSVAFINFSGLQLLLDSFKEFEENGIRGKIITSTYLNFTEPKALEKIKKFTNIDLKVFVASEDKGFHTKAYIFENSGEYKIIIGSSNITQRALKSNVEWNVRVISKKDDSFSCEVLEEYLGLWETTSVVDDKFLNSYGNFLREIKKRRHDETLYFNNYEIIKPNDMQKRAVENLKRLRDSGEKKALIIAATGTGKTYLSAFDVMNCNPKKMLFLVHREEILRSAESAFSRLVKNKNKTLGLLTGLSKDLDCDYLFSTIKSMNNYLGHFSKDEFDYIVLDEAHHASSPSYKRILDYFEPDFLLGMTATPERCDRESIFDIFDNNVALEVRLREALELNLVIPFHYFGITDIDSIDLSNIDMKDVDEIVRRLKVNERVDFIIEKMNFYGYDGEYRKYIEDIINYGLIRYEKEFSNKYYGVPFFKLYMQYKMTDTALLSNYEKAHSSFRRSGLISNGSEYFIFVDLHKEEGIKESINYKDKFINEDFFQWQSPNSTSQNSERGQNIIHNKERNVNLHIFIRKYKQIDGSVQPYIYIEKGNVIEYQEEKPITVKIKLENQVPFGLYNEFVKKV